MPDILAVLISERNKLNRAIEALGGEVGNVIIRFTRSSKRASGKRTVSPEARAKMAAAQRARWAKAKVKSAVATPVKKFTMSAEAKAKISKAKKAWWAKKRTS
jgi:hypothetical protein